MSKLPPRGALNGAELDEETKPDTAHLSSVALAGTPGYLAPERIDNPASAAPAADLYGLGAVFYELLTGRPPHIGATPLDTLRQTRDYDPPSPRTLAPSVPRDAATICMKCLERDPARRYTSAAALADDLRRFLAGEPITARPINTAERLWKWAGRHRGLAAASATASAALVCSPSAAWYSIRLREAADQSNRNKRKRAASATWKRVEQLDRSLFDAAQSGRDFAQRAASALAILNTSARPPGGVRVRLSGAPCITRPPHVPGPTVRSARSSTQPLPAGGPAHHRRADDTVRQERRGRLGGIVPSSRMPCSYDESDGSRSRRHADSSARLESGGRKRRTLVGHTEPITALTFFNGGRWLATASADGRLRIWDPSGAAITSWQVAEAGEILTLAASPDDRTLVLGLTGGIVRFIDSIEGTTTGQEIGKGAGPTSLSFTADGKQMLGVDGATGRLELWNLGERRTSRMLELPEGFARSGARRRISCVRHGGRSSIAHGDRRSDRQYRGHLSLDTGLRLRPTAGLVSV
jgi:hypothetical protein